MRTPSLRHFLTVGFLLVFIPSVGEADDCLVSTSDASPIPKRSDAAYAAALIGKTTLKRLIETDKERAQALGFGSPDEATDAKMQLGTGIPVMSVSADCLKEPIRENVIQLLKPVNEFIYPISVGNKIRSAITVRRLQRTGQWKAVGFGAVGVPSAAVEKNLLNEKNSLLVVRVYQLDAWFLGTLTGDRLTLFRLVINPKYNPLADSAGPRVLIGKPENGRDALATLQVR